MSALGVLFSFVISPRLDINSPVIDLLGHGLGCKTRQVLGMGHFTDLVLSLLPGLFISLGADT